LKLHIIQQQNLVLLQTLTVNNSLKDNSGEFPPSCKFTQILPYHTSSSSDPARTFSAAPSCHIAIHDTLTATEKTWKQEEGKKKNIYI